MHATTYLNTKREHAQTYTHKHNQPLLLVRFSKNDQTILAHKHKQLQTHANKIQPISAFAMHTAIHKSRMQYFINNNNNQNTDQQPLIK